MNQSVIVTFAENVCEPGFFGENCSLPCRCLNGNIKCTLIGCSDYQCDRGWKKAPECQTRTYTLTPSRACERSGKRSGAGRKSGEWERSGERTFQKKLERERSAWSGMPRSGSGAESAINRPLKVRSSTANIKDIRSLLAFRLLSDIVS